LVKTKEIIMKNNYRKTYSKKIFFTFMLVLLSLSACGIITVVPGNQPQPTDAVVPTIAVLPTATEQPIIAGSVNFSMDTGVLAGGYVSTVVPAVAQDGSAPYWEVLPAHTRVELEGYAISNHLMRPVLVVYPVNELTAVNEGAARMAASLQTLLQSPQEVPDLPFLPMVNMTQTFHSNLQFLEFTNGSGLRYLTEFSQGIVPANNFELLYTFQGLTNDGRYYIAAILPVNHPSLPADGAITGNEPLEFSSDFNAYINNIVQTLNVQAANTFVPDLTALDAMMTSIQVN
jgi:hypothetical protein